ncbi:MAG: aspartyl protease family protein [Bacteroidales bacterium]
MRTWLVLAAGILALGSTGSLSGQKAIRITGPGKGRAAIHFETSQNLMLVPASINGSRPMMFVLDTGINTTIVTELTESDTVSLNKARYLTVSGLGDGPAVGAWASSGNQISLGLPDSPGGGLQGDSLEVYILEENLFELSKQLGIKTNGLIGSDFFFQYVVGVDPTDKMVTFWERDRFNFRKILRGYTALPVRVSNQKAYLDVVIAQEDDSQITVTLLIDTGASLGLWIAPSADSRIRIPSKTIETLLGYGLSGEIQGVNGRVRSLQIGPHKFRQPIISFPDSSGIPIANLTTGRHGSLGNDILRRFRIYYDFGGQMIYVRPNKFYSDPFSYNRSGMEVEKPFIGYPVYQVYSIIPDSPADQAGVRPGDLIEYINHLPVLNMKLDEINNILHGESGRIIHLRISREGDQHDIRFKLKERI